jgi:hypothetical protein
MMRGIVCTSRIRLLPEFYVYHAQMATVVRKADLSGLVGYG